jgi:segregation and condensation protein A
LAEARNRRKRDKDESRDESAPAEGVEVPPELAAASRAFTLKLPTFEGPLDLLLHLIREHRLDVFDIPIAFVTDEYLRYLGRMKELNLDVAAEFLVMAATLAHIKSRMLLPKPETPPEEAEEEAGDPRAELVKRLLEYQKYRAAAEDLARQDLLGRDVFPRQVKAEALPLAEGEVGVKEVSVFKLIEALDRVLKNLTPEKQHEVVLDRATIGDQIHRIIERLKVDPEVTFFQLFDGARDRATVIATFLGILELTRLKLIRVVQDEPEGDILIRRTERLGDEEVEFKDDFR